MSGAKFDMGDRVEKISGSSWRGRVVGTYSTDLTPEGYAVESDTEKGSVQIYPAKALRLAAPSQRLDAATVEREWSLPDLRDLHTDVERIRDHDLGNKRMRDLLRATMDTLVAADAEHAALATEPHQHGGKGA